MDVNPLIALAAYTIQFIDLLKQQLGHREQFSKSVVRVKLSKTLASRLDEATNPNSGQVSGRVDEDQKEDVRIPAERAESQDDGAEKLSNISERRGDGASDTSRVRNPKRSPNHLGTMRMPKTPELEKLKKEWRTRKAAEKRLTDLMNEVKSEITREIRRNIQKEVQHLTSETINFCEHVRRFRQNSSMSTGELHVLLHLHETEPVREDIPRSLMLLHLAQECVHIAINPLLIQTDVSLEGDERARENEGEGPGSKEERDIRRSFRTCFGLPLRSHGPERNEILLDQALRFSHQLDKHVLEFIRQCVHATLPPSNNIRLRGAEPERRTIDKLLCPFEFKKHVKPEIEGDTIAKGDNPVLHRSYEDSLIFASIERNTPTACRDLLDIVNILLERSKYGDLEASFPDQLTSRFDVRSDSVQQHKRRIENQILQILDFRMRQVRETGVQDAHHKTFEWLLDEPEGMEVRWDSLAHWLRSGTGCYWIGSKPGSGKSTLLKFLRSSPVLVKQLHSWASFDSLVVASHFLWKVGTDMQKNQEGLLRSLLASILHARRDLIPIAFPDMYQELRIKEEDLDSKTVSGLDSDAAALAASAQLAFPDMLRKLKERAVATRNDIRASAPSRAYNDTRISDYATAHLGDRYEHGNNYTIQNMHFHLDKVSEQSAGKRINASDSFTAPLLDELKLALFRIAQRHDRSIRICLIIDGLDEFEGDQKGIVDFLLKLSHQSDKMKMIVSSRLEPLFESSFAKCPKLRLHEFTRGDMQLYIHDELSASAQYEMLQRTNLGQLESLCTEVADLASGVFLWVKLVVRDLREGIDAGNNFEELTMVLRGLPVELKDLFTHMLDRQAQGLSHIMAATVKKQASKIFQWVFTCFKTEGKLPMASRLWYLDTFEDPSTVLKWSLPELKGAGRNEQTAKISTLEKRILSRCCGLLEIEKNQFEPGYWRIALLHRTVLDFWEQTECKQRILEYTAETDFVPTQGLMASIVFFLTTNNVVIPFKAGGDKVLAETVHEYLEAFARYAHTLSDSDAFLKTQYKELLDGVLYWKRLNFYEWRKAVKNPGRPYPAWKDQSIVLPKDLDNTDDATDIDQSRLCADEGELESSSIPATRSATSVWQHDRKKTQKARSQKSKHAVQTVPDLSNLVVADASCCRKCSAVDTLRGMGYSYDRIYDGLNNAKVGNDVAAIVGRFDRNPEVSEVMPTSTPWSTTMAGSTEAESTRSASTKTDYLGGRGASGRTTHSRKHHGWATVPSTTAPKAPPANYVVGLTPVEHSTSSPKQRRKSTNSQKRVWEKLNL